MKNPHKIILVFCCLINITASCVNDFLDESTQGSVYEGNLTSTENLEQMLIGAYANLDGVKGLSGFGGQDGAYAAGSNWLYGDVYADDAHKGSVSIDQPIMDDIESYRQNPQTGPYGHKWSAVYNGIAKSNDVIYFAKKSGEEGSVNDSLVTQFIAEARFLRGYFHLEAIKMWDFIPYIVEEDRHNLVYVPNKPATSLESNAGNTPWNLLGGDGHIPWLEVMEDFRFAADHLPENCRNWEWGRATKYAAMGMLAKVYMFRSEFDKALPLLNEVISSGKYALSGNYHDNFRISGNNNNESIFDIQSAVNDGALVDFDVSLNGNLGDIYNYPYLWDSGVTGPGKGCCGFYQPTQNLVNAFKTMNGLPYLEYFGLEFNSENVGNDMGVQSNEPFITDPRTLDPRLDWTVGRRGIPYLDWGPHPGSDWIRDQNWGGPYSPLKNVISQEEQGIGMQTGGWTNTTANNYSVLRYADILLMASECEVEAGNLTRARELVNMVRARAARPESWVQKEDGSGPAANYEIIEYPAGGSLDPFQSQAGAREAVRFERRLELGMEGHRFWDLKRWGIAKETLNRYIASEKHIVKCLDAAVFNDRNIRHPITFGEIQLYHGKLKQNPGY